MMQEFNRLEDKVKPLSSITDLARKRIPGFSDKMNDGNALDLELDTGLANMSSRKQNIDPEKVLGSLTAFISSKPLIEKHFEQIGTRFATREDLHKVMMEAKNDED